MLVHSNYREMIIKLLKEHPEGLTNVEIARMLGSHRHTTTKYIYQLVGEGLIRQREIGSAKLCYLRNYNVRK